MLAHKFCDACAWTERPCMSRNELRSGGERSYARFCEWARLNCYYTTAYDNEKRHPGSSLWMPLFDIQEILK